MMCDFCQTASSIVVSRDLLSSTVNAGLLMLRPNPREEILTETEEEGDLADKNGKVQRQSDTWKTDIINPVFHSVLINVDMHRCEHCFIDTLLTIIYY